MRVILTVVALALIAALPADARQAGTPQRNQPKAQRAAPPREPATRAETSPLAALQTLMSEAEAALQEGEVQIAESRYRDALQSGWLLLGTLEAGENRPQQARDAFRRASMSAVEAQAAQTSLAMALLQTGEAPEAVRLLTPLAARSPKNSLLRRLLAQALVSAGKPEEAVQELEEAHALLPDDLELTFALASGHLRLKKVAAGSQLLETVARAKPQAATYVLIGRTYRDFGQYDRARVMLQRALKSDPGVRRAHYYLGTIAIMEAGYERADEAIAEFRAELATGPADPVTHLRLGIVLEGVKRHDEALPSLELAAAAPGAGRDAFEYLGRCQLALGRTEEAVKNLQRALEAGASSNQPAGPLHYQLATALRALGREDEAARHFAEAQRSSEARADEDRARLGRFLADIPESDEAGPGTASAALVGGAALAGLTADQRTALRRQLTEAVARAYFNLGVLHARANRFARAAGFFEGAAAADSGFPQLQYSLGVAYFNAHQFGRATAPLERAAAESAPTQADARRMLALSWLNLEKYDKAAELLAGDPLRGSDPSLQYAYGLSLVRSGRAPEAEQIFSELLTAHGDSPELNVVMGVAHAQQGDYDAAIASLQKALSLKPDVREANGTLGTIYFRQGKLDEAAVALRAELAAHPQEVTARHTLAATLELQGHLDEAVKELRAVLKARPEFADARYLLGKILLAQGRAAEAVDHLEAAARLSPEDANIHFQLAQAYEKSGQPELAKQAFDRYRALKDKKREGSR